MEMSQMKLKEVLRKLPCKVCGEPSGGIHYGVRVCDSCRVFFRRNEKTVFKLCVGPVPVMTRNTRLLCAHCRMTRCLDVGMDRKAGRPGPLSSEQRRQIFEEMRQQLSPSGASSSSGYASDFSPLGFESTPSPATTVPEEEDVLDVDIDALLSSPTVPSPEVMAEALKELEDRLPPLSEVVPSATDVSDTMQFIGELQSLLGSSKLDASTQEVAIGEVLPEVLEDSASGFNLADYTTKVMEELKSLLASSSKIPGIPEDAADFDLAEYTMRVTQF